MPKPGKLHHARNLTELNSKCGIEKDISNTKPDQLIRSAKKIMTEAVKEANNHVVDEELVYILFYRSMELWNQLYDKVKKDSESDIKYFKLMYGEDMRRTLKLLNEYSDRLKTRYSDLEMGLKEEEPRINTEFTLASSIHAKKKKENIDKTPLINGINGNNTWNSEADKTTSIMDSNFMDSDQPVLYEEKYMKCEELKKRIPPQHQDILLIDIRPQKDFESSQIQHFHSVNIPEMHIKSGLSANKLSGLISDPRQKHYWEHRDQYKQVVLLDWNSEEKDVIPTSHLSNLYVSLTKWDPQTIYKNKPLILFGGFEQWLDMYPTFTTNPQIQPPPKTTKTGFVHLNEQHIEYPVLEEILAPRPKPAPSTISPLIPNVMPTIDRSTKPEIPSKKGDKPADLPSKRDESMSVVDETPKSVPAEKPPEVPQEPPKIVHSTPNSNLIQERDEVQPAVEKPQKPIPPRPATPPREEKKHLTKTPESAPAAKRPISDQGEGDGISFAKLNLEGGTRSGGLKRSSSSPNINKLLDDSPSYSPTYDRNTKPRTAANDSYSLYSPRHGGEDNFNFSSNKIIGRGLTGLKNLGNLCYMNSIMQCISHTVDLMNKLTAFNPRDTGGGKRQIATEVASLLRHLWSGEYRVSNCRMLKTKVGALEPRFSTNEQQDSHEFLTLLMDWLHEDLKEAPLYRTLDGADEATGEKAWGEFQKKNNSVVLDLFYGQQKSTITCNSCQKQSILFEPFWHLSIPLPTSQDNPLDNTRTCSVEDCLRLYLKGESISGWNCPNCKCPREATKKLDITRLPPVLIIHLKRFMNMMSGVSWCRKRINMVDFPINDFNMKPYTHPSSELRFHNYNLYAVSNHFGSMEGGHYTAYCKNHMQNKWYKFDDQDVNEMSPHDVKSVAAYILFYESDFSDRNSRMIE